MIELRAAARLLATVNDPAHDRDHLTTGATRLVKSAPMLGKLPDKELKALIGGLPKLVNNVRFQPLRDKIIRDQRNGELTPLTTPMKTLLQELCDRAPDVLKKASRDLMDRYEWDNR